MSGKIIMFPSTFWVCFNTLFPSMSKDFMVVDMWGMKLCSGSEFQVISYSDEKKKKKKHRNEYYVLCP